MKNTLSLLVLLLISNVASADVDKFDFNLLKVNKNDFLLIKDTPKKDVLPSQTKKEERKIGDVYKDEKGYWRKKADDDKGDWYWNGHNWYRLIKSNQTSQILENCPLNV